MNSSHAIKFLLLSFLFLYTFLVIWAPSAHAPNQSVTVAGEVKRITSKKEGNLIYSYVAFLVHQVKNGPSSLSNTEIVVRHLGGESAEVLLWQSDQPDFFVGEFAELTLEPEDQVFKVVGGPKGKLRLDQALQPITQPTAAGYKLVWYKPGTGWQYTTTRPGNDWYGPFRWSSNGFEYWINTNGIPSDLPASNFITYSTASFQTWQANPGSSFHFTYRGTRADTTPGTQDGVNCVGWGPIGGGTIAYTRSWASYSPGSYDSLRYTETDIVFDSSKLWSAQASGGAERYDVQNIGTHEAGHTFGLADLYDPEDSELTMYGYAGFGEVKKRSLEWGDQAGIRALYPGVQITITSSPTGSGFVKVDGSWITTPQVFAWAPGSSHTLDVNPLVSGGTSVQYVWVSWSDGGFQSHPITVTSSPATYMANFKTQYYLTMQANPAGGGAVSPSSGWFDAGSAVSIQATASTGYLFSSWSGSGIGSYTGSSNSASITVNGPITETANFARARPQIFLPPSYLASNPLDRVFFIFNAKKYYITNMAAFSSYGLNWANVKNYTQMDPDSYPNSQINYDHLLDGRMPLPNRPYVAGDVNDGSLYYIPYYTWNGQKYPINWAGYNAYGGYLKTLPIRYGDPALSLPDSAKALNGTNPIPTVTPPGYVIGKNPLNRVFFIFNGYKYYFTDWPTYLAYGFTTSNIDPSVNPDTYPNAQVRFDYLLEDTGSVFRKPLPNQPYIVGDVNDGSLYWVAYYTYTGEKYPINWAGYNGYGGQLKAMHARYGDPSIFLSTSSYWLDGVNPVPLVV